jgi:hypothetical protein
VIGPLAAQPQHQLHQPQPQPLLAATSSAALSAQQQALWQRHCYNQHQQQIQQQLQQQHQQPQLQQPQLQQPQLQQPQQQAYAQDGTAATMRPTDIEKIIEKKKGSQGPVPLFFRGKPRRRGKWLVVS